MDRIAAITISLLVALAVYAFDRSLDSDYEPARQERGSEEVVESGSGGPVVYSNATVSRRASGGGAGGRNRDSMSLGRPPTCVTPLRGCGFTMKKDTPTPVARKRSGRDGGGGFFGLGGSDDD